jgi:hypothetical protein
MGPLLTTRHIDAIERVQRRAARFVTNKYRNTSSVGNMLQYLEWRSLQDCRKDTRLNMFYKIVNNKVEIQKTDSFHKKGRHDIPTLKTSKYHLIKLNTERNLFFPRTSYRKTLINRTSLISFKSSIPKLQY